MRLGTYAASLLAPFTRSLGTCPKCMHAAFVAALAATLVAGVATMLLTPFAAMLAWAAAGMLVLLWLAHVYMFALRWIRGAVVGPDAPLSASDPALWPRRRVLKFLFHTFVFTAVASMVIRPARAASPCNCMSNCSCDDPAFPQCVFNAARGESTCCGPNDRGCAAPHMTYCCPPNTNCYGDGSSAPYCY